MLTMKMDRSNGFNYYDAEDETYISMYNLWRNDDSYMTNEDIMDTIGYTMNQQGE